MHIISVKQFQNLRGKRILVRCDLNVAVKRGVVVDDFKIIQTLPTIRWLCAKGARVILLTHLGRPQGQRVSQFLLFPIKRRLEQLLGTKITYVHDCGGKLAKTAAENMSDGSIILLENVRFYVGEEENDDDFARILASLADLYVNDALAVSHRAHASVSAIAKYLPAYAGLLLEQELNNLQRVLRPKRPFIVIIGGVKLETKVPVVKRLARLADYILIGGMIAYDFLAAQGKSTGRYQVDDEHRQLAQSLLAKKIILPLDFVTATDAKGKSAVKVVATGALPANAWQFDIGPATVRFYAAYIKKARTVVWNGPMGMFETDCFKHGTLGIARLVASRSTGRAFGLVGGGETVAALKQTKMLEDVDWISTSGGAMLDYLAGEKMPGLEPIVK